MAQSFIAIDFETANKSKGSICQIGLACFVDGQLSWVWDSLIDPEKSFGSFEVGIHNIRPKDVQSAPIFPSIHTAIVNSIANQTLVSHTYFDYDALHLACAKYGLIVPPFLWIDSREIARSAWTDQPSYALSELCKGLGIQYSPHIAVEDARACGTLLLMAMEKSGQTVEQCPSRPPHKEAIKYRPGNPQRPIDIQLDGNPEGPLFGHEVVFTGELSISRYEAAKRASQLGCQIHSSVRKSTTVLVQGIGAGANKLNTAHNWIEKGLPIVLTDEQQFLSWIEEHKARQ